MIAVRKAAETLYAEQLALIPNPLPDQLEVVRTFVETHGRDAIALLRYLITIGQITFSPEMQPNIPAGMDAKSALSTQSRNVLFRAK